MNAAADRFAQTMGFFVAHFVARIVPAPQEPEPPAPVNKSANSAKAVATRKSKYGESKMKPGSREDAKKERGFKMTKENK